MEKYKPQQLMEWLKRLMTKNEVDDLWAHLDTLYEVVREAELTYSQVAYREECHRSAIVKISNKPKKG